ncbi:unnamed protein product [Haemonchus placei]|uniref:Transmembrane protein n=1 Tax=Haemonchus placei TaxID=6290 RepID=A0A0N4WTI2_HAEPC|nr:unnamed protein product [Haemonchus placei]
MPLLSPGHDTAEKYGFLLIKNSKLVLFVNELDLISGDSPTYSGFVVVVVGVVVVVVGFFVVVVVVVVVGTV